MELQSKGPASVPGMPIRRGQRSESHAGTLPPSRLLSPESHYGKSSDLPGSVQRCWAISRYSSISLGDSTLFRMVTITCSAISTSSLQPCAIAKRVILTHVGFRGVRRWPSRRRSGLVLDVVVTPVVTPAGPTRSSCRGRSSSSAQMMSLLIRDSVRATFRSFLIRLVRRACLMRPDSSKTK
jgi:hypothetical protein